MHVPRACVSTLTATATLTVVLGAATQQDIARGQIPPPVMCKAVIKTVGIDNTTWKWVPFGPSAGWQYTWNWHVDFDCSNGNFTNCDIDIANRFRLYDQNGVPLAPSWAYYCAANYKGCNTSWQTSCQTVWPAMGGVLPGRFFDIEFHVASHDASKNYSAQNYQWAASFLYQAPPAP